MTKKNRLQLLTEPEIEDFYARPNFNSVERELYFAKNSQEMIALRQYSATKTQIAFRLQLAYFKAKQKFFEFTFDEVHDDVAYLIAKYYKNTKAKLPSSITRQTLNQQKQDILNLFDYQDWSLKQNALVESHLCELLRYYPKGNDTFRQLLVYFENQKILLPSYRTLQDLFTRAFSRESERIGKLIQLIPQEQQEKLSNLIRREEGSTKFNVIRADQKSFKYNPIKEEVAKAVELFDLYVFAKEFLPSLQISKNAIRYYSDLAEQYAASRLRRVNKTQQYLQALCFIYHRYQQIMDNLITSFMFHIRGIMSDAKKYAEKARAEYNANLTVDVPKLAKFMKWFPNRKYGMEHEELNREAYNILPEKQFPIIADYLMGSRFDAKAAKRGFYLQQSRLFALYLRPVLLHVSFEYYKADADVMAFIEYMKNHYGRRKKGPASFKLPQELEDRISETALPYLKQAANDEQIDPHLFEFFVYQKMYHRLDKNLLCCNDSVTYCDVDHDLVTESVVDDAEKIANEFGYKKIPVYCDERLDEVLDELDRAWERTTSRINRGENQSFKIKETKSGEQDWSLGYDGVEKLEDSFFKKLPQVEIPDIMMHMGDRTNMWDVFTHMKSRYNVKTKPPKTSVNACILADAFGISTEKMAEMSDMNFNLLRSTHQDYIRVDTMCASNNNAANLVHGLPIFKLWDLIDNKTLGDGDGQKMPTSESTIQSRYSKKYLGKAPGISVYTLIANFIAVNAKNIGLNEYEGHSLYDLINGNKTDINIDMVTGDNHSLNQLNFVILDSIDVEYVPSIKDIKEAARNLLSVKPIAEYNCMICPSGVVNASLIRSQKRGILRILLSLLLQENTQSTIVKKINSSARYSGLKKALFEYNKLLKSIHVLNLIDNVALRKAIRTARNRTEAYHQLQGLIRKIYRGVFKGKKIVHNRVSAHAVRLVANCIIAYNSIILNIVYEQMLAEGVDQELINKFARISPIAWAHIAFTGKYNFKKSNGEIDITAMVNAFEKHLKQYFWKV